jgi:hypothetical protein
MQRISARRGLAAGLATAALAAGVAALGTGGSAVADSNTTTPVSAGPASFTQAVPSGSPSQYGSPLERCANGVDHPVGGANPILSEPLNTAFTSNVGLSESVSFAGNQWYGDWTFTFTNTSTKTLSTDCAVLIWRAASSSDDHSYGASVTYGHPQQDYVEVPRGDGTSFYIARLGFHDVTLAQRQVPPGGTFTYRWGGQPSPAVSLTQIRDSLRFTADLTLDANQSMVLHYGTNRLTN